MLVAESGPRSICYDRLGKRAIGWKDSHGLGIWSREDQGLFPKRASRMLVAFQEPPLFPSEAAFSPDMSRALALSGDGEIRIWDAATGKPIADPIRTGKEIYCAAFSPDGARIGVSGDEGLISIYETNTGELLTSFAGESGRVSFCCFSDDGLRLATLSRGHVRIYDCVSRRLLHTLDLEFSCCADFSPNGTMLAVSGQRSVTVWDARSGRMVARSPAHPAWITGVKFSPDGVTITTTTSKFDYKARVWRLNRPDYWWGVSWLPEFWLTAAFAGLLVWSVVRDRRALGPERLSEQEAW